MKPGYIACLMFRPPREEGREALSQFQCDKGQPEVELNALEKSTRRMKCFSGGILLSSRQLATVCIMALHPEGIPTPNCKGIRNSRASDWTDLVAHFEVKRRITSPTTMCRRPPFFFLQGRREAPQRCGVTLSGTFPAHKTFINFVKECKTRKPLSGEGQNSLFKVVGPQARRGRDQAIGEGFEGSVDLVLRNLDRGRDGVGWKGWGTGGRVFGEHLI